MTTTKGLVHIYSYNFIFIYASIGAIKQNLVKFVSENNIISYQEIVNSKPM